MGAGLTPNYSSLCMGAVLTRRTSEDFDYQNQININGELRHLEWTRALANPSKGCTS